MIKSEKKLREDTAMAENTDIKLRNKIIYSVFVRNHTVEGTFRAVIPDLDRIKVLGADYIWLMPIHPIGKGKRKGTLGSPYANMDYRTVNPEYGTLEDFKTLVDEIHRRGMKVMIDVVYNHTSPDSVLWNTHPEFFYKKPDGHPGNHVGEWTDIIDLDYTVPALWDYQIESLCYWAGFVDGFRCDVASFVPVEFWLRAREAVAKVNPDCVWLAETVHREFGDYCRRSGMYSGTDTEMFAAFDMEYEYDTRQAFDDYIDGKTNLGHWLDLLSFQDCVYPANYNKLRFLENHDLRRIASVTDSESDLKNFTAMLYFEKGATLIYAGQEAENDHQPTLFDKDTISWDTGKDLSPLMVRLAEIKKKYLSPQDSFIAQGDNKKDIAVMLRQTDIRRKIGVFSLRSRKGWVSVEAPDGEYRNLIDDKTVIVENGRLYSGGEPVIIAFDVKQ